MIVFTLSLSFILSLSIFLITVVPSARPATTARIGTRSGMLAASIFIAFVFLGEIVTDPSTK